MRVPPLTIILASLVVGMEQKALRVLCFGDSLTAGFSQGGGLIHPYVFALKASLKKEFPDFNVTYDLQGAGGDQVISPPGGFWPRMDTLYEEATVPYTFAVILGGTNDLAMTSLPGPIFKALKEVWAIPLKHGSKVLALTVPESGDSAPEVFPRRVKLNSMILDHKADNFYTMDLRKKVPYFNMSPEERKKIWDDGTHFTAKGYDLIGRLIAERITEIIEGTRTEGILSAEGEKQTALRKTSVEREKPHMKEINSADGPEGKTLRSGRVVMNQVEL